MSDRSKKREHVHQILNHYPDPSHRGHVTHKLQFQAQCVEDIETSISALTEVIRESSAASDRLGNKIFILNIILGILTLVGTVFTAMSFFK